MKFNRAQVDSLLIQLRDASDEMRRRLFARQPCRVEDLFQSYPRLRDEPELAVRLVHAEWAARVELGEHPAMSSWLERFPQWRNLLERRFREDSFFDASELENTPTVLLGREGEDPLNTTRPAVHFGADLPMGEAPLPPMEIHEEIGRGAMGVVYLAWDKVLDRAVALKKLRAGLLDHPEALRRFYHEARSAARLNHPNIIAVHGMGKVGDQHGFTMPLAKANLDQHRDRFASPRAAAGLLAKVARAVHAAHRHGLVHRDLKPANILLDERDEPLVADFGLAVLMDEADPAGPGRQTAGTPHYMAPEQFGAFGGRVSEATDVWALGVILYEMVTGKRPFKAKSIHQLQEAVRNTEPARLVVKAGGDRGLEAIVHRCLAKDPRDRYATAEALAEDLEHWRDGKPLKARPDGLWTRTRRAVRSHPALVTAIALLLAFTVGAALRVAMSPAPQPAQQPAPQPEDPDALALRSIHARLKHGETVEFVTDDCRLLRHRWIHKSGGIDPNENKEGVDVNTLGVPALLELLPDVPLEHYEFRAELRISSPILTQPGIYALHAADLLREVPAHSSLTLSFAEQKPLDGYVFAEAQYQDSKNASHTFQNSRFQPTPGEWHALAIEVTPDEVRLRHNTADVRTLKKADLAAAARGIRTGRKLGGGEAADPVFNMNGGVGLYLVLGQATFRSITLKPLP
jgi:tRNA A-37 threonylcarbamoyl transferase component Bud32